jgi:hypothetical protein
MKGSLPTKEKRNPLLLLEINEINFDVVAKYIDIYPGRYKAIERLLRSFKVETVSEENYKNLEPWIQWVSVHSAQKFSQHQVFRLGDIVGSMVPQIFESVEKSGFSVGVISAMNAENRLQDPAYFVPDPWTRTPPDSTIWSKWLSEAVSQVVNDNSSSKITVRSVFQLMACFLRFAQARHYWRYLKLLGASVQRPWMKALFLDLLLHDVHWVLFKNRAPDFSTLFLNAGAHIQHHYFFNSLPLRNHKMPINPKWYIQRKYDPMSDMLDLYDMIVGEYLNLKHCEALVATGLSQKPYDRVKFYYRLRSHKEFLKKIGIDFIDVVPRMTRDFLVEFQDVEQAEKASVILSSITIEDDGLMLFGEIDNRGKSLFVTLTYPHEIKPSTKYCYNETKLELSKDVVFVAIKNGMHRSEGFAFFTAEIAKYAPCNRSHVGALGESVTRYFGLTSCSPG